MSWKQFAVVASFPTLEEAHLAKNLLEVHGITSILDEYAGRPTEHANGKGVHLLVRAEQTLQVRDLLPNKERLVEMVPQRPDSEAAPIIAGRGLDPGFDGPGGPSLNAVLWLFALALVLAAAWIIVTVFTM